MKKLLLVMCVLFIASCSKDEACDCEKLTYEVTQEVVFVNGLPRIIFNKELIDSTSVGCQDETTTSSGSYEYKITCGN